MYRDPSWLDLLLVLVVVALTLASMVRQRLESDPDPIDEAKAAFAAGEIDAAEFDRRLEFHLDDRNDRIRAVVEDVNGVGPRTSKAIAREFDSLEDLRRADREDLEAVYGVGAETAEAVLERVR